MRLYKGIKKRLWKKLRRYNGGIYGDTRRRHRVQRNVSWVPNVGDICHDCDGFNHKVVEREIFRHIIRGKTPCCDRLQQRPRPMVHSHGRVRWYIQDFDFLYMRKGQRTCFCGCTMPPDPARPLEEIEEWIRSWDSPEGEEIDAEWKFGMVVMARKLKAGEKVCKPDGTPLEEP